MQEDCQMRSSASKPQLLVLGMHRSGTSALAGLLERMGAYLGPEEQRMPALDANAKGYHERLDVMALNDRILAGAGSHWMSPQRYRPEQIPNGLRLSIQAGIESIIAEMNEHRPWCIKDPRLCITLDLWLELLEHPFAIILKRNPLEIARSLSRRGDCGVHVGLALWEAYMKQMLEQLDSIPHAVVSYADLLRDPAGVSRSIQDALVQVGLQPLNCLADAEWIDPSLCHHAVDVEAFNDYATSAQQRLLASLQDGSAFVSEVEPLSRAAHDTLEDHDRHARSHKVRAERLTADLSTVQAKVRTLYSFQERLHGRISETAGGGADEDRTSLPRVCAFVHVHDELRYVGPFLDHMIDLGVDLHVFCDRSPPSVVAEVEARLGHGVVAVESVCDGDCFCLGAQLRRVEWLASASSYDWYIRADIDEFRMTGHANESLPMLAARAESAGFNAIQFLEYVFIPTEQEPDHDHAQFLKTMRRYYLYAPPGLVFRSMWKYQPCLVDLESSGGRDVTFPGIRTFPEALPMCHYPFLSAEHVREKYQLREYPEFEAVRGWHTLGMSLQKCEWSLPDPQDLHLYDPALPGWFDASSPRSSHWLDWK